MTVQQHMQALALGNKVRLQNAEMKRRIAAMPQREGRRFVAELLENDESYVFSRMDAADLVRAIRQFGPETAQAAMHAIGVSHRGKRVGQLTPRQRVALADLLRTEQPIIGTWLPKGDVAA